MLVIFEGVSGLNPGGISQKFMQNKNRIGAYPRSNKGEGLSFKEAPICFLTILFRPSPRFIQSLTCIWSDKKNINDKLKLL